MRWCALLLMLLVQSAFAQESRTWNFRVYLDDKPIGFHRFELRESGARRELQSTARFDVKVLFINAYRYAHDASESWQGDCLQGLTSRTDDNGKQLAVSAVMQGMAVNVTNPGSSYAIPGCVMSFAYWNPSMLRQTRLLNAQTGEYETVTIHIVGDELLAVRGVNVASKHYRLTGNKLSIDLWYSGTGEWLALQSITDSGRTLRYVLS